MRNFLGRINVNLLIIASVFAFTLVFSIYAGWKNDRPWRELQAAWDEVVLACDNDAECMARIFLKAYPEAAGELRERLYERYPELRNPPPETNRI